MQKPIRTRARWRIGELTGAQAALDAGATVGGVFAHADHYDPATGLVRLTMTTATGDALLDIVHAVHEAMHARQWAEVSISTIFHRAGTKTRLPWLGLLVLCSFFTAARQLWPALACFGGMIVLSLFKAATILNLEREAWDMTKEWFTKNYVTTHENWAEIDRISKEAMGSYLRGFFRR